ncbi:MAG TPA: hypothetical protein VGN11_11375, partial [Candidatus Baltobacteraceae bacterium]|nr:hypothetical protein [Candidatus Baltobacteraceae bacterium]
MQLKTLLVIGLALSIPLAACGGGGSAGLTNPPVNGGGATGSGSGNSAQTQSENAIDTANALGDPVKTITSDNSSIAPSIASRNGVYE